MIGERVIVQTTGIGAGARISEFSVIRADATIGEAVVIHPHVVIESGITIGDKVEIYPGTYIGKFQKGAGALSRAPVNMARIEIGANCSIEPHAVIFYDLARRINLAGRWGVHS